MSDIFNYLEELERKAKLSRLTDVRDIKVPVRIANIFWKNFKTLPVVLTCYPLKHIQLKSEKKDSVWEALIVLALFMEIGEGVWKRNYLKVERVKTEKLPPMVFKLSLPNSLKSAIKVLQDPRRRVYEGEALRIVYYGYGRFDVYIAEDVDKFDDFAERVKDYMGDVAEFKRQLKALKSPVHPDKITEIYEKVFEEELSYYAVALRSLDMQAEEEELPAEQLQQEQGEDVDINEIEF